MIVQDDAHSCDVEGSAFETDISSKVEGDSKHDSQPGSVTLVSEEGKFDSYSSIWTYSTSALMQTKMLMALYYKFAY